MFSAYVSYSVFDGGVILQVMIDFQAAEKKRLQEPASEIGLEPLCDMVSVFLINVMLIILTRVFPNGTSCWYTINLMFYLDKK